MHGDARATYRAYLEGKASLDELERAVEQSAQRFDLMPAPERADQQPMRSGEQPKQ